MDQRFIANDPAIAKRTNQLIKSINQSIDGWMDGWINDSSTDGRPGPPRRRRRRHASEKRTYVHGPDTVHGAYAPVVPVRAIH